MYQRFQRGCVFALLALWLVAWTPATAADFRIADLIVAQLRSHPTAPAAAVGVVYFSVTNAGHRLDRLLTISSPIARAVEIHESRNVDGMMQMRAVDALECPPGVTVKSEPGGLHVMLLGLSRPLTVGMEFPMTLHFQYAGMLLIRVQVSARE